MSTWLEQIETPDLLQLRVGLLAKYDPDQPRDEAGRWTDDGDRTITDWFGNAAQVPPGVDVEDARRFHALWGKNYAALDPATARHPEWLAKYRLRTLIAQSAAMRGQTVAQFQKALEDQAKRILANADVRTRVTPAVLSKILDEGRFKNQFSTRTSNGYLSMQSRRAMEAEAFGIDPKAQPSERPIYGYFGDTPAEGENPVWLSQYGSAVVHFDEGTKERSTFTYGDSLPMNSFPSSPNDPEWESAIPHIDHMDPGYLQPQFQHDGEYARDYGSSLDYPPSAFVLTTDELAADDIKGAVFDYVEAQVQGGATVSDIASVELANDPDPALTAKLDALSIPWSTYDATYGGTVDPNETGKH